MLAITEQPNCSPPVINLPPSASRPSLPYPALNRIWGSWTKIGAAVGLSTQASSDPTTTARLSSCPVMAIADPTQRH